MLNEKTLKLYSNYVKAYNKDSDGEEANETYSIFTDSIFDNFDPDLGDEIIYTLCLLDENDKLDIEENLRILKLKLTE